MINESNHQEDIPVLNVYEPKTIEEKYISQKLVEIKEIYKSITIVEDQKLLFPQMIEQLLRKIGRI